MVLSPTHEGVTVALERLFRQWFGKDVRRLVVRRDAMDADAIVINILAEVMIFNVNMFGTWAVFMFARHLKSAHVVLEDLAVDAGSRGGLNDAKSGHFIKEVDDWNNFP